MINHFRVDSKLIHGQITTRLLAFKHCNRILLIDDTVAGDESMRNIFSTVIPHSVKIHFRGMRLKFPFVLWKKRIGKCR